MVLTFALMVSSIFLGLFVAALIHSAFKRRPYNYEMQQWHSHSAPPARCRLERARAVACQMNDHS